ncbi:MAG: biopolymer transporter Tol [Opitutus sp.]
MRIALPSSLFCCLLCASTPLLRAAAPTVPDWALPGSSTHKQVPPPADFHRATTTTNTPIGQFEGASDVGGAVVPGSAKFDPATKQYTINSAGYNIWYTRDEFHYLWKKMSGDVSLAADIVYPNSEGYGDRKAVFIIRQDLDDDSKEAMTALHGAGLIHLAQRPEKNANIKEAFRMQAPKPAATSSGPAVAGTKRIGIEKHGDSFTLFVSLNGEPMHAEGPPMTLHFDEPFYVGIGFCSHVPDKSDTAILSNVVFEPAAGKVH